ncbi:NAD(P)-dependent oxidoreductase [Rhizobium leguminosarum bv. trifolii]|uniref:NAD(P)-dependent oxidoreductase n=1 Tax=Rhizobium leguminosarum bv. trifolii TaxID=386 RepID=A0A3E1B955_RHILT|nr:MULTISPECIES: SDR family oxidoreductase [Rhizobium]ANM12573.1 short-chain dehydrogenase protein [Rhizobium sp. N324]ANM18976.1 short-chain dehydrogenase protein [Rhizobium sp. N541]ANM25361.1 short-chain dehydrogenase protein [Rhizobium sp. N941]OYD01748.1 short-chain dehydrogenase protein [Rhizobium sp. N4311]RFB87815.1 NAD(P)-dependent oxidoreductase [Rhizobium leguminosarum bv. trifolii]
MSDRPVVLVTGGSRGIGAAVCHLAARRGWRVAVNYAANRQAAEAVVAAIAADGGEAVAIEGDVGKAADIAAMFAAVDRHFGRLDGLVNNAGIVDYPQRVDEMSAERIERMLRVNVTGSMLCAAEAIRRMSSRYSGRGGAIVNISSMAAILGSATQYVDYAASKAAIDTFTVGLSREVAAEGIRVNAIRPGVIETDLHASGGLPDRAREMAPSIPLQRAGTAEEVADAVLYLLSPSASYITGAILNVSGGR